jgi:hypothetical protein
MSGNSIGYVKASQTKKEMDYLRDILFNTCEKAKLEIENCQEIWSMTLECLQKIDRDFDEWYASDAVPEVIIWKGEEFQLVLRKLWERISYIKQGDTNEKAAPTRRSTESEGNGSFIYLWGNRRE